MKPLRYSINVTFDGCVDHQVLVGRQEFRSGAVALRYEPSRVTA